MKQKFKIQIGMPVVLFPTGNNSYIFRHEPKEGFISKIGRKYFYVSDQNGELGRFDINTFKSSDPNDCNAGFDIYESMDEYLKQMEYQNKLEAIRKYFRLTCEPSYEVVCQIFDLLNLA